MVSEARIDNDQMAHEWIKQCINALEQLASHTERYYGEIIDSIPHIEEDIGNTEQEIGIVIKYFVQMPGSGEVDEDQFLVAKAIRDIHDSVVSISEDNQGADAFDQLMRMFLGDQKNMKLFSDFIGLVDTIAESISNVADLSINAIIYSARFGQDGKGFGVISDTIHQRSKLMDSHLQVILGLTTKLKQWYKQLNEKIAVAVADQNEAATATPENIMVFFASFTDSIQSIADLMENIFANLHKAVEPFNELMVLVQRQDIIRQNIENTVKCLRLIEEKLEITIDTNRSEEQRASYLPFVCKSMDLVNQLFNSMGAVLTDSLTEIQINTEGLSVSLAQLSEDTQYVTEYLGGVPEGDATRLGVVEGTAVEATFLELMQYLNKLVLFFRNSDQLLMDIADGSHVFNQLNLDIKKNLITIQKAIDFLCKVGIIGKLELARLGYESAGFGEEIIEVIKEVQKRVTENREVFGEVSSELHNDLVQFEQLIGESHERNEHAMNKLDTAAASLQTAGGIITNAIMVLNQEVGSVTAELKRLEIIVADASDVTTCLQQIKCSFAELTCYYQDKLTKVERDPASMTSSPQREEFEQLYELFTSYLERVTAKEFTDDQDLDVGTSEGSFTMF